jgi:hypothetical protein
MFLSILEFHTVKRAASAEAARFFRGHLPQKPQVL